VDFSWQLKPHFIGKILIIKEKNSMNYGRCLIFGEKECKKTHQLSLSELESAVFEITKKQNYISNCGLSAEVTSLAIKELQEQKKELLALMHRKVDEL